MKVGVYFDLRNPPQWRQDPSRLYGFTLEACEEAERLGAGDLGSLDAERLLRFHGRLRDMIVRGGENIYAREVEQAIESHPDVAQAAVVGLPDDQWGETVAAAVVPRAAVPLRPEDLNPWVAQRLASFKRPRVWHIVDDLPTTASGKPQKFRIVEALNAIRAGATRQEEN